MNSNSILLTHAVLVGLTPLIPIPLVDDIFYARFRRSLVQRLATYHAHKLQTDELEILASSTKSGCALGCVGALLLYPMKKLLSKIFFFLEIKRAADTMGHTYAFGVLLDAAFVDKHIQTHGAARVRAAIDAVLGRTDTSVFNRAARSAIKSSPSAIRDLVAKFSKSNQSESAAKIEAEGGFKELVSRFQSALTQMAEREIRGLREELARELNLSRAELKI